MTNKSQTSTEYIILVAVVIVIAVVVSSILGDFPGIGGSAKRNIGDYQLSTSKVGVSDYYIGSDYSLFKLRNNHYGDIRELFPINLKVQLMKLESTTELYLQQKYRIFMS